MRFSDFLLVSNPTDLDFIVGYTDDQNIRINVLDLFAGQIIGSGTAGYIPLFTSANVIDDSVLYQDGSNIVIGGEDSLGYRLAIAGSLLALDGAVIESSTPGSDTFRTVGEEGDSFIIPNDSYESVWTSRRIMHAAAVLSTESATLGQVNTAVSDLEGDIEILLDLKVDKSSVGEPNGVASLDATGKIPLSEIPDSIIGQVEYMGTWDAFTNTPTLNPLVPEQKGHYYVVSAAGVFGGVDYAVGDWIISNGVEWQKVDNTDAVTSVFGRIGAILPLEADYQSFYPRLSQAYDNPTWINSLAFTKITDVPPFLLENQTITLSGDVMGSGKTSISSTISNNAVSNEKLRDSVGTSVIGRSASSTGDPADIQASTDGHVLLRSAGNLLFGLISSDSISSIDWSKITGTPTTLGGYGITDAYTKTESDNKFVPYTGANANVNLGLNSITANSFIKVGGTSAQFLKADGSVDLNHYVPTTRSVNAGTGLTGGGNLSSDITIAFDTAWGDNRYAYRTRQLTINGVTYDLSADRTWVVGTVNTLTTIGTSGPATLVGNVLNIPDYGGALTGYVPYTGATQNLNLGTYGLLGDFIQFNTAPTSLPTSQGTMYWDTDKETIDVILNGTTGSIFQDTFFFVKNQTGALIPKGTVVRANGTVGSSGRILIAPFLADGTFDSKFCLGVTTEDIADGDDGRVTYFGAIRKVDTSAYPNGTVLYASPSTSGGFTATEPNGPTNNIISVAIVVYSDATNGEIFVRPTFVPSAIDIAKSLNYTPANAATTLTINGTTYDLSTNRSWSVGDMLLDTIQTVTARKDYNNNTLQLVVNGTSQKTVLTNSPIDTGSYSLAINFFGFNASNNLYFSKGGDNNGIFAFNNVASRTYTLKDASGTLAFTSDIPANPVGGTGTTNYLTKFTGASTIGNSTITDNGSIVSVLNSGYTDVLRVGSTFNSIYFYPDGGSVNIMTGPNFSGSGITFAGGSNYLDFNTNSLFRMRLSTGGNLLVGTTTDAGYKLDVNGAIRSSDEIYINNGKYLRLQRSSGGLYIQTLGIDSGTDNVRLLTTGDFNIVNGSLTNLMTVKNGGNVLIGSDASNGILELNSSLPPSSFSTTTAQFYIKGNVRYDMGPTINYYPSVWRTQLENIFPFSGNSDLVWARSANGGAYTTYMRLNQNGLYSPNGINASDVVYLNSSGIGIGGFPNNGAIDITEYATGRAAIYATVGGNTSSYILMNLREGTGGLSRFYVRGDGNVGIGTASPSYPLQVRRAGGAGSLGISIDSVGTTDRVAQYFAIQDNSSGAGSGHAFYYRAPNSTTDVLGLFLNESGNVGIGTSSPSQKLEVNNGASSSYVLVVGQSRNLYLGQDSIGAAIYSDGSAPMYFATNATERMRITSTGNVGINQNIPSDTLQVNGGVTFGSDTTLNNRSRIFESFGLQIESGAAGGGRPILFNTNLTERMRITSSGNVLIGTTTDFGQKFQVFSGNTSESTAHINLINSVGYSGYHFLDGTAYYIGQNSNFRSLRMYSGGSTGTGVNLAAGATSWGTYSDERLKDNIEYIDSVLNKLSNLRTVKYHLKNIDTEYSKKRLGLIAQDLVGNFDEVLSQSRYSDEDETEYYDVRYTELIPVLIKAIQELKTEIDLLKTK